MTFEIKKRNKDRHKRVSHGEARPSASENSLDGWHAFVFPDMKSCFVSNAAIAEAIANGDFKPGQDDLDQWAEVDALVPRDLLRCSG